jgi:hypothetical protein
MFAAMALASVGVQAFLNLLNSPDLFRDHELYADLAGVYFLPFEDLKSLETLHDVLLLVAPISVLTAVSCATAACYGYIRNRSLRLVGASAAVVVVPLAANFGLSLSRILPDNVMGVAWAALVLWFVAVASALYVVLFPPSWLFRQSGNV